MEDQVVANQKLIEGCLFWDKITRELQLRRWHPAAAPDIDLSDLRPRGQDIYSDSDYLPLACRIDSDKAEVIVGSSPGHAVHVELDRGEVTYYDVDRDVNEIMASLLEAEADLKCHIAEDGVKCEGLKSEAEDPQRGYLPQIKALFRVLAMPTSMDLRQNYCQGERLPPSGLTIEEVEKLRAMGKEYCAKREKQLFEQVKKAFP